MTCENFQDLVAGTGSQLTVTPTFPFDTNEDIRVDIYDYNNRKWVNVPQATGVTGNFGTGGSATDFYSWVISSTGVVTTQLATSITTPKLPSGGTAKHPLVPNTGTNYPLESGSPVNVRVYRKTSIDKGDLPATFYPGSSIKAEELNENFEALRRVVEESACSTNNVNDAIPQLDVRYWNKIDETVRQSDSWETNDQHVATSGAIEDRYWNNVDIDNSGDTYYDSSTTAWNGTDSTVASTGANDTQYETLVQEAQPTTNVTGKTWFRDSDDILHIWNGSTWVPVKGSTAGDTIYNDVFFVSAENGDDAYSGHSVTKAMKTIAHAVKAANGEIAGQVKVDNALIFVFPGVYEEIVPIDMKAGNMSIVGQAMRSCFVHPNVESVSGYDPAVPSTPELSQMFRMGSGSYITGFTFAGMKASGARGGSGSDYEDPTYGLPVNQGWIAGFLPNAKITKSPYIQNCTNFADSQIDNRKDNFDPNDLPGEAADLTSAPTGGGILVKGSVLDPLSPLKSFVVDSFTQICLDGPGVLCTDDSYAQLVSFFGTFCHFHAAAIKGSILNLSNCTTDFGSYGLIADGRSSSALFTGDTTEDTLAYTDNSPNPPTFPSGQSAFDIKVNVNGLGTNQPGSGMLMQIGSDYYEILSATKVSGGACDVTISNPYPAQRNINMGFQADTTAPQTATFYNQSYISSGGHTFEYCGYGTDYTALPSRGGTFITGNAKTVETGGEAGGTKDNSQFNGGRVWQSSTDEVGRFQVGETLTVDQKTGYINIDPSAVSSNLVSDLTPDLGGDLDVNNFKIVGDRTAGNGDIVLSVNGSSTIDLTSTSAVQIPAGTTAERNSTFTEAAGQIRFNTTINKFEGYNGTEWGNLGAVDVENIGTNPNQIPLNQMLGQMAFVDNVATLRPFTTNLSGTLANDTTGVPQPVFVGEGILFYNVGDQTSIANRGLYFNYRADTSTVVLTKFPQPV